MTTLDRAALIVGGLILAAVAVVAETWATFLDALLGPRCQTCGERVFPRDQVSHVFADHADQWPEVCPCYLHRRAPMDFRNAAPCLCECDHEVQA